MKVLFLTHIYPSAKEPTRGPYNFNIIDAVSKHCDVRVVVPEPWWSRTRDPAALLKAPVETHTGLRTTLPTYWSVPRATHLHARGMYASLRSHVASIRREFPFDVIFAAWAYPDGVAAVRLADYFGSPVVINVMGSDINVLVKAPALMPQIRDACREASKIITVSHALRHRVVDLGISPERVVTQHNGVNGGRFALRDRGCVRAQLGLDPGRTTICAVGRLGHEKGADVLVEAVAHMRDSGRPDIQVLLVGGGEMESALRSRVQELRLDDMVRFCGMRPHDEIPLWISAADLLCLPSRREGCPNVVLEALASGVPVVASNVGGVAELVNGDNGILVPAEDPQALAFALRGALDRAWEPQALRGSVEFLSWQAVGANYVRELRDAVNSHVSIQSARVGPAMNNPF
jgi:glycosyltransferase involved in cell wall biosynthesis